MAIDGDKTKSLTDIVSDIGNYFSNRRNPAASNPKEEVTASVENSKILLEHLQIINGLPPMYDNIVDPPLETDTDDYQYNLTTLFDSGSGNSKHGVAVGRAYIKNVLASGNYLTLVPLELQASASDFSQSFADQSAGGMAYNLGKRAVSSLVGNDDINQVLNRSVWQRFSQSLDIGSFGYTSKIAGKRYWRHVAANMKSVLYALGVDMSEEGGILKNESVKSSMPEWIIQNLSSNTFYNRWKIAIDGIDTKEPSPEDFLSTEKAKEYRTYMSNAEKLRKVESKYTVGASFNNEDKEIVRQSTNSQVASSDEWEAKADAILAGTDYNKRVQEHIEQATRYSFYSQSSIDQLKSWVLAASKGADTIEQNLPFVSFYVNGVIEKNMSATQSIGESELGAIIAGRFLKDMAKSGSNTTSSIQRVIGGIGEYTDAISKEIGYSGGANALGYFLEGYVPRINKGVEGDISYSINIRALSDGSDPISIAAHCMYTLSLLMPFYIEPVNKSFKVTYVPKAPLMCSAFCKGVFNIPRGCITSIDIKTDPVFQTTESVSTDLEIGLTLVPFVSKGFTADFGSTFNASSDASHLITALFNPFSSFNVLVTLCGMNTTMTKINENIFKYLFISKPTSVVNMVYESWEGFKSAYMDFSSSTLRNLGVARSVRSL